MAEFQLQNAVRLIKAKYAITEHLVQWQVLASSTPSRTQGLFQALITKLKVNGYSLAAFTTSGTVTFERNSYLETDTSPNFEMTGQ